MGLLDQACKVLTPTMILWAIGILLFLAVLYMLLEYWLGKRESGPGSVLEAIGMGLVMGIGAIFNIIGRKKENGNDGTKNGT